jgi:hypothetical protein
MVAYYCGGRLYLRRSAWCLWILFITELFRGRATVGAGVNASHPLGSNHDTHPVLPCFGTLESDCEVSWSEFVVHCGFSAVPLMETNGKVRWDVYRRSAR